MAPVPEAYFPSLDKCFSGDAQLLSWRRAFLYTCNPQKDIDDAGSLYDFLSHPESIRLLSNALNPFPSSSTKSKADFESKSSAIHTETTTQASYDLKEIKADALWLSEKAGIDEITALRISVLEWQNRPAARLLTRFSEEETTSLQNAAGADNLRTSLVGANFTEILRQKTEKESEVSELASEGSRRLRLRNLYISEKAHAIKTSRKLLTLSLYKGLQDEPTLPERRGNDRKDSLCDLGETIFANKLDGEGWRQFIQDCVNAVRSRLTALEGDGGWLGAAESNEEVEDMWRTISVEEIVHILQMLFLQLQAAPEIPSADLLLSWLQLMADYGFLESLQVPCQGPADIQLSLQGLVSLTTLTFLKLPLSIPFIVDKVQMSASDKLPYFLAKDKISQINELFMTVCVDFKTAHPTAFSWGLILHTMRELALNDKETRELEQFHSAVDSFQSNTPHASPGRELELSLYEELLDNARTPKYNADECIVLLTSDAMKSSVFETSIALATKVGSTSAIDDILANRWVRVALLDVIRVSVMFLDYSPEIVESVLAILTGSPLQSPWASDTSPAASNDPRCIFMKDRLLMDNIFHIARSRFPYETVPFLKLCRSLVSKDLVNEDGLPEIINELELLESFTQMVPPHFQGYETIREDENANYVALVQSLPMFDSSPRRQIADSNASNALVVTSSSQIPSTTEGQIVSESKPAVVMWHHQYSCLSFLGSWLEEWNENGGYSSGWGEDSIAEVIGLLADLLTTCRDGHSGNVESGAKRILEMASDGLSRQSDVVSLIFEIFERNLQNIGPRAVLGGILDSTISCLRFIQGLVTVLPGRVWPLLARSSLLGSDGKGGVMTAIVSAIEVPSGEYPFLLSCVSLFERVVGDAASRSVLRRSPNSVMSKLPVASEWGAGVPSHIMRSILLNFLRTMVEVYNSNINWRFNAPDQRLEINTALARTFESVLYYAYGTNDTGKVESKVTGVFSASASYLLDILRPQTEADLPFNQIFRLIIDGLQTPPTLYLRYLALVEGQVKSTLALSTRILQAAQLFEYPISLLEDQLFKATPALVKLYALHDAYRLPVVSLLDMLITRAAADSVNEPPSLVGHLGAESSCLFLDVLSQFDQPLNHRPLHLAVWHLLSVLVSKRQQWLAVYILTGSSPRQSFKKDDDAQKNTAMRGVPFLQIALDRISNIEQSDLQVAVSLLEFVSNAQEHWPWATPELRKHPHFFNSVVNYVSKLKLSSLPVVDQIFATRIAALVADLCAVYLHSAKEMRDESFVKTLIPLVSWFSKDAVEVSGYNASLHANLKKNFEMRYSGCKLVDFKKSSLETRNLGRDYYYDTALGEKLLSYDFAWAGTRNQGFEGEFERANINLSLVEAQVSLLHSWKFFAVEHCADFITDREVQKSMALVVQSSLEANTRSVPQEAIFTRIQQTRADFAQSLLQRLVEVGAQGSEFFGLLRVVWDTLRACRATYEEALANDDTEYYRSLLNVLFLALQFHLDGPSRTTPEAISKKPKISSDIPLVVEITKIVVAQGFKALTTYLHDQPDKCTPKDFAILTAILQTCLQVKDADRLYEHIVFHIEDNDTARYATSLFSWADQLAVAGDPVYGDISISFLVKLSTIPMLAEHLAVEAVLMRLSTCRLTNILRQPKGFGPFDPVPRFYTIWTSGILPLCLNLLYHVIRTAPEVAAFLNQFEGQLNRSAESFSAGRIAAAIPGPAARRICLSMASEAYSLALITFILDRFREAGASAGMDASAIQELKWDKAQVKEDIEELLERKQTLRGRIAATNDKEVEMARQKPLKSASGAENRLEEKIVGELKAALVCLGGEDA